MARDSRQDISKARLWTGRVLFGWIALFLLFDAGVKVLGLGVASDATSRLGLKVDLIVPIGIVELICTLLYLVPRTSIARAFLMTAYLGGATAIQIRAEDAWFLFPIVVGIWIWGALALLDLRVETIVRLALAPRASTPRVTAFPVVVRASA